ncbi:hypothetical protein ABIB62_003068 [Mucilaginibacter sp. UYP25]|uniref:hypothetical protein n=1 Tax=unclassified Mucilaginibacter TaxID=2617802 RepID=UPI003398900B
MKNTTLTLALLFLAASGMLTACKKDNKGDSACAKVAYEQKAIISYTHPCAVAISKSGVVAVIEFNGFVTYGTYGTTSIYSSVDDFITQKAPAQTFLSRGAEAAIFDANENLYIAETEATAGIRVFAKIGPAKYQFKTLITGDGITGGFSNPRGMAFDEAGRLFIANDGKGNVVRINDAYNNGAKQIIAGDFGEVKGVAIIGNNMFVTVYNKNQVWKITLKPNGDYGEVVASYDIDKPVDIAVKYGVLAVSSPNSGKVTLLDPDKFVKSGETYSGCKSELTVGSNVFGIAFNPLENGLLVAHLDQNRVLYFKN